MRRIGLILFTFVALNVPARFSPAAAGDVPVPPSKRVVLDYNDEQYNRQLQRQRDLKTSLEKIDDEIGDLRKTMVRVAREVKNRERDMSALEDKIAELQTRRTALQRKLQKDHKQIASMASALLRIRQVPPEALIARPGAPLETAQAAMILKDVMTPLQLHAQSVYQDLAELQKLEQDLKDRQESLKTASKKILEDQTKLADLIRRRESAYASVQNDLHVQDEDVKRLARDAADFKDLLVRLDARNKEIARAAEISRQQKPSSSRQEAPKMELASLPDPRILKSLGDIQMPISGIIRVGYGATDDIGSQSQGIRIEGRAGALVVAPMNGIVRYRGNFKNYGNMIIIEHAKNYHSLVAGLAKIDTVVGQSVVSGEPLGTLGTTRSARPSLYYELRQNGKPINPSRIFADLG